MKSSAFVKPCEPFWGPGGRKTPSDVWSADLRGRQPLVILFPARESDYYPGGYMGTGRVSQIEACPAFLFIQMLSSRRCRLPPSGGREGGGSSSKVC